MTAVTREIRLNAVATAAPVHLSPGLWRHPRDRSREYKSIRYWTDLARILEAGLFDGLFLADSTGASDIHRGSIDSALRHGALVPRHDPFLLVSAMAHVTHHLGFGVSGMPSLEPPLLLARRLTTLDHLTKGRIGWNIVTGCDAGRGAKEPGDDGVASGQDRYDFADEYMELVYKLWERSWEECAVLGDRDSGIYARPEKVRTIQHHGRHFDLESIHFTPPSPQRTPLLHHAGSPGWGQDFAAMHAETVFVEGASKRVVSQTVADIRARADNLGRHAGDILFFALVTVIVGETEEAAHAKLADYRRYADPEGLLRLLSGWAGTDLSRRDPDEPIAQIKADTGIASLIESVSTGDSDRVWTLRELLAQTDIGGRGPVIAGSAEQVADALISWVANTGIDGFNLSYAVMPGSYEDFVSLVVPELQKRGAYKTSYRPGTWREKLSGQARLADSHPAAGFRT